MIVAAYLRHPDGGTPISIRPHLGTAYSFYERIGQVQLWQHRRTISAELTPVRRPSTEQESEVWPSDASQCALVRSTEDKPSTQGLEWEEPLPCAKELSKLLGISEREAYNVASSGEITYLRGRSGVLNTRELENENNSQFERHDRRRRLRCGRKLLAKIEDAWAAFSDPSNESAFSLQL
jgi:hypothetical protein